MTVFVRMRADQKILEVDQDEAEQLIASDKAGATATFGIVQFLEDWTNPTTGKTYRAGDFESFHDDIPEEKAIADKLKSANIAKAITR